MARENKQVLGPGNFKLADGTAGIVAGRGPPLIFLHGVGLDRRMWQAQVYFFARTHSVICYDLLGHGDSAKIIGPVNLDEFVMQLERLFATLGLGKASLIGFSFGGLIAQDFAARHSAKIEKLILISTVYDRSEAERAGVEARLVKAQRQGPASIYPAALERWFSPAFVAGQPEQMQELHHRMLDNDEMSFLKAYEIFAFGDQEIAGRIGGINCPTLIMTGEHDRGSTPAMAWRMAKKIPNARVCIIAEGRHMMPMEMAQEVNRGLASFILER
jgi:(E)-2-((N-methylformamido)methylene)succinate hydrolase